MFYVFLRYDGPDTGLISISETHTTKSDSWRKRGGQEKKKVAVVGVCRDVIGSDQLGASSLTGDSPPF